MEKTIKIGMAVLLALCLFDMPYAFYQLVRFLAMIGFGWLAVRTGKQQKQTSMFVYLGLALLFQPLLKVSLGRELWSIVDVIVATGLFITTTKS